MFQTEYEFELPKGYVDEEGNVHAKGIMRLAAAIDEISAAKDPRCRQNPDYIPVIALSRVVVRLGNITPVTPEIIEKLYTGDFSFLQNMYGTINEVEEPVIRVQCPHCGQYFTDTVNFTRGE